MTTFLQDLKKIDDETGHFGQFGGRFVPEALISALDQLEDEYLKAAAVAVATPCCPAPVSAMIRFLPIRTVNNAWPITLLIL